MPVYYYYFLIPPVVRIPGVKSKNVKNIKAGWNGYVSVSSSSKKVSRNKITLKCCASILTLWKRNWASNGSPERSVILRPSSSRKKSWCRSVARVTRLPQVGRRHEQHRSGMVARDYATHETP